MRASLRILVVGLAVVVGLSTGPVWGQERPPSKELDPAKELGLHVDKVLEGSEEIKPGEDMGEPTPRGIFGMVIVANYTPYFLYVSRGSKCNNPLGIAPPKSGYYSPIPMPVGDFQGDTKLCAKANTKKLIWRQTVTGSHATYRWNIR